MNNKYSSLKHNKLPPLKIGDLQQVFKDPPIFGIPCSLLHEWLSNDEPNKLILIDLRSPSDYKQSHIHSRLSLNLPQESVTLQKTNDYSISALLTNKQDQTVFDKRFDVEHVIFIDYCDKIESSFTSLTLLVTLVNALTRYSSRDISAKMGYLVGGFLDFADQYSHMLNSPLRSTHAFIFNSSRYEAKQAFEESACNLSNVGYGKFVSENDVEDIKVEGECSDSSKDDCSGMRKSFRKFFSKSTEPPKDKKHLTSPSDIKHLTSPSDDNMKKNGKIENNKKCLNNSPTENVETIIKNYERREPSIMKGHTPPEKNGGPLRISPTRAVKNEGPPLISPTRAVKNEGHPLISPTRALKNGRPRPTNCGLKNIGNTCFMNAVVQCVRSVGRLNAYFISGKYRQDINKGNKLGYKGVLCEIYYTLLVSMDGHTEMCPTELRDFTAQHSVSYSKGEQHDAHEFLNFILDALHEDLNRGTGTRTATGKDKGDKAWRDHLANNQSIISECFQGLLKSTVCCLTCHTESVTFDVFMFLALPIPSTPDCSLNQCLHEFYLVEQLSGIYCAKCQAHRDANKHVGIWRFPPTLIIFFMRFLYSNGTSRRKDTCVTFPMAHLHLTSLNPSCAVPHYSLLAVVNHVGSLNSGHYTCDVLRNTQWYNFDDSDVRRLESPSISKAAYILFYECTSPRSFIN